VSGLTPAVSDADHRSGPDDAPVTLVEYGDFECPSCGAAYPIVEEVRRQMGPRLRFVFRHFPLTQMHPHAMHAAEAAEAAGAQGKYWQMHGMLFEHQDSLEDADLPRYAKALHLDVGRFNGELASEAHVGRIREHVTSGIRSGVNGTPTFFINGLRHNGSHDLETLLSALRAAR
jgi:protein-disulfide isomerase